MFAGDFRAVPSRPQTRCACGRRDVCSYWQLQVSALPRCFVCSGVSLRVMRTIIFCFMRSHVVFFSLANTEAGEGGFVGKGDV